MKFLLSSLYPIILALVIVIAGGGNSKAESSDFDAALLEAVRTGNSAKVKKLNVHIANPKLGRRDPVRHAIKANNMSMLKALIDSGADINRITNDHALLPLEQAAKRGNIAMVKALIAAGAHVNYGRHYSSSPLKHAIKANNIKMVKVLLDAGAEIYDCESLLEEAAEEEVIRELIISGCEITSAAIYKAQKNGYSKIANTLHLIKAGKEHLIKAGKKISCEDIEHLCRDYNRHHADRSVDCTGIKPLCLANDINRRIGSTSLGSAVSAGNREKVDELITKGAIVNVATEDDNRSSGYHYTPLQIALRNNYRDIASRLIVDGANVNATIAGSLRDSGVAPLFYALRRGWQAKLIAAGANVNSLLYFHEEMVDDYTAIEQFLTPMNGIEITPLYYAVLRRNEGQVRTLIDAGAIVNAVGDPWNGFTPLHLVAYRGDSDMVMTLLKAYASINIANRHNAHRQHRGATPLHYAAHKGNIDVVTILIDFKANVNATDDFGLTPLHVAAMASHAGGWGYIKPMMAVALVPSADDCNGDVGEQIDIIKALVEAGADVNAVNGKGETPLQLAVNSNRVKIVAALKELGANGSTELALMGGCSIASPALAMGDLYMGDLYMVGRDKVVLYTLDTNTGVATSLGSEMRVKEGAPQGLASHKGTLYMVGGATKVLYTLNTVTGEATRVGSAVRFGVEEYNPRGLASHKGTLYMVGGATKVLYTLNTVTGEATRVGSAVQFGVEEVYPQGLASHKGTLYMVGDATNALYTLNTITGEATRVRSAVRFGVEESQPRGLASHKGTLYMLGDKADALYTLDTNTGVATRVGNATRFGVVREYEPRGLASH